VYVTGDTFSSDFPVTPGAFDTTLAGQDGLDAFVTRVSASGASLLYSTYLGGASAEIGRDIALDSAGHAYVTGTTESVDYPTTAGAFDTTLGGPRDVYVTELDTTGASLLASTFLGGDGYDEPYGICLAPGGLVYVTGWAGSPDFPTTPDGYDVSYGPQTTAFLTGLDPAGGPRYSTFFGGDGGAIGVAVAAGADGSVVFTGVGSAEPTPTGFGHPDQSNVFVAKLRPPVAGSADTDTPGVYVASTGAWFLRNSSSPGGADVAFSYGAAGAGLVPLVGDWNGDGTDTPGLYTPATGAFFLKNTNGGGGADIVFTFGAGGAGFIALSGDWDGDGADSVGLYAAATGVFFLRDANAGGSADTVVGFGPGGAGIAPVTGDWNGDGVDTVGLYVSATATYFLRNDNAPGPADLAFSYGPAGVAPLRGDWNGDGVDTVGVYASGTGAWFLRDRNSPGAADLTFSYGPTGVVPLAGNWDGQ
jgi:hypothetical protein